ncbi:MAG: polysaccharide biosynthesis protein [Clostridia bacterium]|nr:polysaccharide biosynthesis protein [Clostridia bacterium]
MERKGSKGSFLKGAAWIAAGGFIAKLIGALYRIPLTNLIGGRGLGLYQLVYPVYCLLLTVSATGIPSSIAKLTAERIAKNENDRAVLKTAMKLFLFIGVFGSFFMALTAPILSKAQGSGEVLGGYYALAPSVFFVSAISVFRGWFQGRNRMFPTALSEITEQAVKVGFGLLFAYLFREDIAKAVVFLLLSVSLSELATLLLMIVLYKRAPAPDEEKNEGGRCEVKTIIKLSVPVTFSSILLPLSALLDSVLVPRFLSAYASDTVTLYGLFAGGAVTVINLPVSVCYGIAAASVPRVTTAAKGEGSARKAVFFSLGITLAVGAVSALGLYLFAEPAAKIIFRSLAGEELTLLIELIKAFSISALTLSCVQTLSACLTAQGKPQYAALSMMIALTLKTGLYLLFLPKREISVFGLAYATNIAYAVAFLLDLLYNIVILRKKRAKA